MRRITTGLLPARPAGLDADSPQLGAAPRPNPTPKSATAGIFQDGNLPTRRWPALGLLTAAATR
jgi:hypothetical protein